MKCQRQHGMAVVLVLWMIAGMSLTVAALIHFSRGDTEAIEFRLQQTRADAVGRGVALLAIRDERLSQLKGNSDGQENRIGAQTSNFIKAYSLGGLEALAAIVPGNRLLSLNDASEDNLVFLFESMGEVSRGQAQQLAQSVINYRSQSSVASFDALYHPGFRYREELLALPGMSRAVYDRVRPWVHAFRTGDSELGGAGDNPSDGPAMAGMNTEGNVISATPVEPARGTGRQAPVSSAPPGGGGADTRATDDGRLTFESMFRRMEAEMKAGTAPTLVVVKTTFGDDSHFYQLVWVDSGTNSVVSAQAPVRKAIN